MEDSMSIISLFANASLVVQAVMLLLLAASIASWVVIFQRGMALSRAKKAYVAFEKRFWSGIDLNHLYRELPSEEEAIPGAAGVFRAGFREYSRLKPKSSNADAVMDGVQRSMRVTLSREEERLNIHLPFLASVSSVSPYVGLFGTVWGIMGSFQALGTAQSATLTTVAPWIAEALVATAMGLFAAIPAVIFYNRMASRADHLLGRYEDFAEELHSILHRNLHSRGSNDA